SYFRNITIQRAGCLGSAPATQSAPRGFQGLSGRGTMAFIMKERGLMRTRTSWLTWLWAAALALAPTAAWGQDYNPPDPVIPLPTGSARYDLGGFYTISEFLFMEQTNPLRHQVIAVRGLLDFDGSIIRDLTGTRLAPSGQIFPNLTLPGTF